MRNFIIFVALIIVAIVVYDRWDASRERQQPKYTLAEGAKLDLQDMKVLAAIDNEYSKLVEAVVPSVVAITTTQRVRGPFLVDPFEQFFGPRRRRQQPPSIQGPLGSGVIVSKEGHIITNNHVIANVDQVRVQLNDGRTGVARLLGTDPRTDIAVLKLDLKDLAPLPFGDSDHVRVGQLAFAVGNPFGFNETVTHGIISARRRDAMDNGQEFFQTDTPINPGNSGGPLVNLQGEIIGINSAIFSGSGGWQGVGFAIPANVARRTLESVLSSGRVVRGYLGLYLQELTPELAQQFGFKDSRGALVAEVMPGSPAEKAGIRSGDVVEKFNGARVKNARELHARVGEVNVGSEVKLDLNRAGETITVTARIEEQPAEGQAQVPPPAPPAGPAQNALTGIYVAEIPPGHRAILPPNVNGVMVAKLDAGAPASGVLQVGDVIEEINQQPVRSVEDYTEIVSALAPDAKPLLFIARGRNRLYVVITP
jgi:serine protease Do